MIDRGQWGVRIGRVLAVSVDETVQLEQTCSSEAKMKLKEC